MRDAPRLELLVFTESWLEVEQKRAVAMVEVTHLGADKVEG